LCRKSRARRAFAYAVADTNASAPRNARQHRSRLSSLPGVIRLSLAWSRASRALGGASLRKVVIVTFVGRRDRFEWPLSSGAYGGLGSFAHCRIFQSGQSVAILLTWPVGVHR